MDIDTDLMKEVKRLAVEHGRTVTSLVEDALRGMLAGRRRGRGRFRLAWRTVRGRPLPGVDVADRDALYEKMEGRG